jgi:hypothetical protein
MNAEVRKAFALVDETMWRAFVGEDPGSKAAQDAYADAAHSLHRTMMYIERFSEIAMTAANDRRSDHRGDDDLRRREVTTEREDMLDPLQYLAEVEARIKSGWQEAVTLGECRTCGGQVRVLRGKTGKRYAACVGKDGQGRQGGCGQTFQLPQGGTLTSNGQTCADCGWPQIKVMRRGSERPPWVLCVDPECPGYDADKRPSES